MAETTYLTILRKLYQYTGLSLADAGLSVQSSLEAAGLAEPLYVREPDAKPQP